MKRLVSGIQPTGQLHIGNYLGAIKQWVELQEEYEAFYFVVDYHALTARPKPDELLEATFHVTAMLLALGVDPKTATLALQSQLSQHTELGWILNNFTTLGQLNRMTQFKEKSDQHGQITGLYTYPVLMAADILLYHAEAVPVGEDQVQHLELAREAARTFNAHAGRFFTEPKPILNHFGRVMALNDPAKKMSKSVAGSSIGLLDDDDQIAQTIKRAVTDSDPNSPKLSPALKNLFAILAGFSSPETMTRFEQLQANNQLKYSELKEQLTEDIIAFLQPVRKTYQSLMADKAQLEKILIEGKKKAEPIAKATLKGAKEALGLIT
jgi:tryptophanyl-tRNA synthetase